MKLKIIAFSLCALVAASPALANKKFDLGRTVLIEGKNSHAKIVLPICRHAKEIRIQAERDTYVTKAVVEFNSGQERTFQFQRQFDKNEKSDWRQFSHSRCVKNIQFYGRAEHGSAGIKVIARN